MTAETEFTAFASKAIQVPSAVGIMAGDTDQLAFVKGEIFGWLNHPWNQ
jgi:hypothetical protein